LAGPRRILHFPSLISPVPLIPKPSFIQVWCRFDTYLFVHFVWIWL